MKATWPQDRNPPPRLPPGKAWNPHPKALPPDVLRNLRQLHDDAPSERIADGTMRDYQRIAGPCVLVVVAPVIKAGHATLGWQVSTERRGRGGHAGPVEAVSCDTLAELVGVVAALAKRLTLAPPDLLHVTMADELDAGVRHYCGLVLLAAMSQAPHGADALAA